MCGIAGFSGEFSEPLLAEMNNRIAHRGPDASGLIVLEDGSHRVGLAHRRLAIIDLSPAGRQPMTVDCEACGCRHNQADPSKLWLSFNGEIYNFLELRRNLESRGHRFSSRTDSEVLLHLYAEYGAGMLERLNGIFALAIYDGRSFQGDLLLARDGLGVKPLYLTETPRGVLFSSELKSLLAAPDIDRTLDLQGLNHHLTYLYACAPRTMFQAVRKLEPGHATLVRNGQFIKKWAFYRLPYGQQMLAGTEHQIAEELRDRVQVAVARQLMGDVPIGAFLSGGLDSSSIVAMMRRLEPDRRIACYSIDTGEVNENGNPCDLPYAVRVATQLNVDLHIVKAESGMMQHLEQMLYLLDEPQADPAPINALLIAAQARRDGIKVLMSGAGGDDIFSGYRRHQTLQWEGVISALPLGLRTAIARLARASGAGRDSTSLIQRLLGRRGVKFAERLDLPRDQRMTSFFRWGSDELRGSLLSAEVRRELSQQNAVDPLEQSLSEMPGRECDPLQRMLYLETRHFLADHNLNYTDKTSMAHGVEVRVPLLDRELVDFAARIPPRMKQKGRVGKSIFKRAMQPLLPRDVIYRKKSGFGAPLAQWLRNDLRDLVEDTLSERSLANRGLFDPQGVRRLINLQRTNTVDGTYPLFAVMCVELWLRMFVDGKLPAGIAVSQSLSVAAENTSQVCRAA